MAVGLWLCRRTPEPRRADHTFPHQPRSGPCLPSLPRSPAIVGVSKRWQRVSSSSRQLWRQLHIVDSEPDCDLATSAGPLALLEESRAKLLEARQARWQAAVRAQLAQVGQLVETFAYGMPEGCWEQPSVSLGDVLPLLNAERLVDLSITVSNVDEEEALLLARFTRLTSLAIDACQSCDSVGPILRQLPRLQHLTLGAYGIDERLIDALLPLTGLTCLVSRLSTLRFRLLDQLVRSLWAASSWACCANCCTMYLHLQDLCAAFLPKLLGLSSMQQLHHLSVDAAEMLYEGADQLPVPASFAALQSYCFCAGDELLQASDETSRLQAAASVWLPPGSMLTELHAAHSAAGGRSLSGAELRTAHERAWQHCRWRAARGCRCTARWPAHSWHWF